MRTTFNALVLLAFLSGPGVESLLDRIAGLFSMLSASESVETGCKLDPNGQCAPAPSTDTGCKLDPSGVPVCSPAGS